MHKILYFIIALGLMGCSKDDPSSFIWDKSFGDGSAYDTAISSDSLYLVAGVSDQSPLFIKTIAGGTSDINYSPTYQGVYTSILEGDSSYFLAGSSEGNILLASIDGEGVPEWDTIVEVNPEIRITTLDWADNDVIMAIASDHPDSLNSSAFVVIYFNTEGEILEINESAPGFKVAVTDAVIIPSGEIFISVTKNSGGDKSKASVARITPEGNIIWETELYNNQNYGAGSLAIAEQGGNLYVAGRTELNLSDGSVMNSFAASLASNGVVTWKKYLENSNSGTALQFDANMNLVMLNMNCLILNFIPLPDGDNDEMMRVLDVCDSYDTGVHGMSLSIDNNNNYFISGTKNRKFYYALRSGKD